MINPDYQYYGGWYPIYDKEGLVFSSLPINNKILRIIIKRTTPHLFHKFYNRDIVKEIKKNKIDVILAQYGPTGCSIMDACNETNTPLIVHFHGFDASEYDTFKKYSTSYKRLFSIAKSIIVVSNTMKDELVRNGASLEKIFYNPCGVDTNLFKGTDPSLNPLIFVSVGRFAPKKAPDLTIMAFNEVHNEINDSKLVMVGDGPLLGRCQKLVKAFNLSDSVIFKGVLQSNQIKEVLSFGRVFVQHSVRSEDGDMEGTPVSILEASAMGLPIVSTRHSGIVEAVIHGKTGFLVKEHDYKDMAKSMISLAKQPKLVKEFGKNAREHMINNYSLNYRIERLKNLMESVVS